MSTILKALRRLEQERSKDGERPLREQVVLSRARRRGPWAAWLALGVALALGFAATWALLANLGGSAEEPAAVAAPPPTVAAAPPQATSPTPARVAAGAPPVVAAVPAPAVPPPTRSFAAPERVVVPPTAREPEPVAEDEADEEFVVPPMPGRAPRIVEEETPARSARAELPVSVVRTSWHPQADRRAAWVAIGGESAREVREGEWVGAYEVRSIEPDGVLFADGPLLVHRGVGQR